MPNRIPGQVHNGPVKAGWSEILRGLNTSSVASVDLSWLKKGYLIIEIEYYEYICVANNVDLNMRYTINAGSSYNSGASDYGTVMRAVGADSLAAVESASKGDSTTTAAGLLYSMDNATSPAHGSGRIVIYNPEGTSRDKSYHALSSYVFDDTTNEGVGSSVAAGVFETTSAVDGIQFLASSGNISRLGYIVRGYI